MRALLRTKVKSGRRKERAAEEAQDMKNKVEKEAAEEVGEKGWQEIRK